MTVQERNVLLALNLHQMQGADSMWVQECGVTTTRIAKTAGRTSQSTAATLSHMRDAHGWVRSYHGEEVGWFLVRAGVEALERDAGWHDASWFEDAIRAKPEPAAFDETQGDPS